MPKLLAQNKGDRIGRLNGLLDVFMGEGNSLHKLSETKRATKNLLVAKLPEQEIDKGIFMYLGA